MANCGGMRDVCVDIGGCCGGCNKPAIPARLVVNVVGFDDSGGGDADDDEDDADDDDEEEEEDEAELVLNLLDGSGGADVA